MADKPKKSRTVARYYFPDEEPETDRISDEAWHRDRHCSHCGDTTHRSAECPNRPIEDGN